MSETSTSAPAGWYPDQTSSDMVRYWDGTTWTAHRASAQAPARHYWGRYRASYPATAGILGALAGCLGFLLRISQPVPEGGSYSYALGVAIGTAILFMLVAFVLAMAVNLLVARFR